MSEESILYLAQKRIAELEKRNAFLEHEYKVSQKELTFQGTLAREKSAEVERLKAELSTYRKPCERCDGEGFVDDPIKVAKGKSYKMMVYME